jgi:hypothetical protein
LKNHGPGNNGEKQEKRENPAGNPAGLRKKILQINQQKCIEQKNNVSPSVTAKFSDLSTVAHA